MSKVVLITGASSGIGLATAQHLHQAGLTVYGTSRRPANTLADVPFHMLQLDVSDEASIALAIQHVIDTEGRIDVLINNAGIAFAPAAAEESSLTQVQQIFDTNFFGLVRMNNAIIPQMRQQGVGQIINIGSVLGFLPLPFGAYYAATKHAIEGYSASLDHELRSQGIRVSVIEPAYTNTSLDVNLIEADRRIDHYNDIRAKQLKIMTKSINRSDDPSIVAQQILAVIEADRPQQVYTAGKTAKRLKLINRFAPKQLLDRFIQKSLKL